MASPKLPSVIELKENIKRTKTNFYDKTDEILTFCGGYLHTMPNTGIMDEWFVLNYPSHGAQPYPPISVQINGNILSFGNSASDNQIFNIPPFIYKDRVFVPMRKIFETLGAEVIWNEDEKSITAKIAETEIKLAIGSEDMQINSAIIHLDVSTMIENDVTYIPVRAISEAFGARVEWDNNTKRVNVFTG
jgi:hypothetical protein